MHKMLAKKTDFVRPVVVTNDGYTIIQRMEVEHPAARLLLDASKWLDFTVGDGTLSVMVLTGALLEGAKDLLNRGVHPSTIVEGYTRAERKAEELLDRLTVTIDPTDRVVLTDIARSCIETKIESPECDHLANLVTDAAVRVAERTHLGLTMEPEYVNVVKKTGGGLIDSELIDGMAIFREPTSHTMPRSVEGARIALVSEPLQIRRMVTKPEITINSPEGLRSFTDEEHRILMDKVETILKTGANVIICGEGLDDYVQITLGRRGILAIRRATSVDMKNLARAIGGRVVADIDTITEDDIGYAKKISVRMMEGDNWLFVEGCKNPKAVTILLRGSSSNVVEGAGRAIRSALLSIDRVTRKPSVFPGGGSLEAELSRQIATWSLSLPGREQLAARKYAEALESIPRTLAETSGLNTLDALLELRSAHANGMRWFGVDVRGRKLADMTKSRVVDVKAVKLQVIQSASEVARTLIRIDSVFTKPKWNPPRPKEGPAAHRVTAPARVPGFDYGEAKRFIPETW